MNTMEGGFQERHKENPNEWGLWRDIQFQLPEKFTDSFKEIEGLLPPCNFNDAFEFKVMSASAVGPIPSNSNKISSPYSPTSTSKCIS
jgi:hypothetical protein